MKPIRAGRRQRGFSIIAAIFILVVLAVLGSYIVYISTTEHYTSLDALRSAQALSAARSGIEYAAYKETQAGPNGVCDSAGTLNLGQAALSGFKVSIGCSVSQHTENGSTRIYDVYQITAFATAGTYGQPDYASRRIEASLVVGP